jgi:hypothetical protein
MTPHQYLEDFEHYLLTYGFTLSGQSREIALLWEQLGQECNLTPGYYVVLQAFLLRLPALRSLMMRKNADPDEAIAVLRGDVKTHAGDDAYSIGDDLYSATNYRGGYRAQIADYGIAAARRHGRSEILPLDLLEGYLDAHDEEYPPIDNVTWRDEALHVVFNTLAHIRGRFHASMWVRFEDIRKELGLQTADAARKEPVDAAPLHLKHSVLSLLAEHPDYRSNCFLIMPFRETEIHRRIHKILKAFFFEQKMNLLRADDRIYSEDVLGNIETYLYGCRFAVAVHERVLSDEPNPNVAFEIGYMLGLKKDVCLLKERTVKALPSDLSGRLYVQFDSQELEMSLRENVGRWLENKSFAATHER